MRKAANAIIAITLVLVTFGIIMLASTSGTHAERLSDDQYYFLKRQLAAMAVGFAAMFTCARIPYSYWRGLAPLIGLIAIILLVMTLIPGIGVTLKGSSRWLRLGPVNLQPSEIAKFAMIIGMARWLAHSQRNIKLLVPGMIIPLMIMGSFVVLVFAAPDFGTTMLMGSVGFLMMFTAGTRFSYLSVAGVAGLSGITIAIMHNEVRMRRILAFLNPEKYAETEAYQLLQAIYAFVEGGLEGVGLGGSVQKKSYLPEAHTDFIMAIIGEELGLIASLVIVVLFAAILFIGLYISHRSADAFGRFVAFGITMMIAIQAAINIGVVTGMLPTKGLALPLISYGGTSMVITLSMIGVLVNIAYRAAEVKAAGVIPGDRTIKH